jgi:ribonuclease P protein subunit RPR2
MIRVAQDRISDLFGLAEQEGRTPNSALPDRYVQLARRIGMRYNVRLLREYAELYCRGCGAYWVEGRTVRTRLRGGRRTRTCLRCGRVRRMPLKNSVPPGAAPDPVPTAIGRPEGILVGEPSDEGDEADEGEEE